MAERRRRRPEDKYERAARICFSSHLQRRFPGEPVTCEVSDIDPPDYILTVGGIQYSVEAVCLFDEVQVGEKAQPSESLRAMAMALERQLMEAVSDRGALQGFYVVDFGYPPCARRDRRFIKDAALEYIERTRGLESAGSEDIWPPPKRLPGGFEYQLRTNPLATIAKLSRERDLIQVVQPTRTAWLECAKEEAVRALNSVIATKTGKLRQAAAPKPWILLTLHRHPFVAHTFYRQRLADLLRTDEFESIFIAKGGGEGYFLIGPWAEV